MKLRVAALLGLCAALVAGCPTPGPGRDGGDDLDAAVLEGECTGGCADNQICEDHQCVDGCRGTCDLGQVCVGSGGIFGCSTRSLTCGTGPECNFPTQNSCVANTCSCTPARTGLGDLCAIEGRLCQNPFNPLVPGSGTCQNPRPREECRTTGCYPTGTCPGCPAGYVCDGALFGRGVCVRDCSGGQACDVGEGCFAQRGCLPSSVLPRADGGTRRQGCYQDAPDGGADAGGDGGRVLVGVPESSLCLVLDALGEPTEDEPTGNCGYVTYTLSSGRSVFPTCRPPGTAGLNAACRTDYSVAAAATRCATGLECFARTADEGVCLEVCNAADPSEGYSPQPACAADQACVNLHRQVDRNAVVGVCMPRCNVFHPAGMGPDDGGARSGLECASFGTIPSSCVPVPATGVSVLTRDGQGVCMPQQIAISGVGQGCIEPDPFRGAACPTNAVCIAAVETQPPQCRRVCDLECSGASPPERCGFIANATCPAGKACEVVTQASGVTLGLCAP